ncbi:MAG: 2-oxo acid dehydrogenase subunit E2 [Firmicutes bacterium]|nr:2-oxo acid dehydrogenase subunit E2 [Bacillota bacterium]
MKVVMPRLGLTMKQGRVEKWMRRDGETVSKGEPLLEVLSEKVTATVPSPADGVLRILVPAGQSVPVGTPVAALVAAAAAAAPATPSAPGPAAADATGSGAPGQWVRSTPAARRLARELGLDLAAVTGTGPDGLVTEQDVRAAHRARQEVSAETVPPTAAPAEMAPPGAVSTPRQGETRVPLAGRRRVIAERMAASATQTAAVTLTVHADMTKACELREALLPRVEASHGVRLTFTDIVVRVAAAALRAFPYMNASLDGETVVQHGGVHIGVAVDTDQGLVVPVIRDADRRGLGDIAATRHRLTEAARAGTISPDDLVGGTFTVTNLGMYEIEVFSPLINLPEAAILGVGAIEDRPVAQAGQVVVRPVCTLSLVFDHRIVDGAPAARFLRWIKSALENPALLLL